MRQRTLVFGKTGQVATELRALIPEAEFLDRNAADLSQPDTLGTIVADRNPDIVINAVAYTAVDKAESEPELANRINGEAPGVIARACAAGSVPMIHISTDYVFDGSGAEPWREDAPTGPINAYGISKLMGERQIVDSGCDAIILRTSWVFSAHGQNFVKTMLKHGHAGTSLKIVADQFGGPTAAADIAATVVKIAGAVASGEGKTGIYHYCGTPYVSWAEFAAEIFQQDGLDFAFERIPAKDYDRPATAPDNSRLDCQKIANVFGISTPNWRKSLSSVLEQLKV